MSISFSATFLKEGKWYVATAVDFGVVSQGRTLKEAQKNLTEAVELFLEDRPKKQIARREMPIMTVLEAQI